MLRKVAWLAVIVVAGCAVAGEIFTRSTLHAARRIVPAPGEPVEIRARDGITLKASWFPRTPPASRCILLMHGVSDSRASMAGFAPKFLDAGYAALATDSRAHGESGGDRITYGLIEKNDTIRWAEWLRQHGCTALFGLGESLGGSVLLQAAAEKPEWNALVVESAFADIQDAAEQRLERFQTSIAPVPGIIRRPVAWMVATNGRYYARLVYGLDFSQASPLKTFARVRIPVLLIHGLDDDQTPPDHSRRLAAINPHAELWLVPGVRHESAYNHDPQTWWHRVSEWFASR